MCEKSVYRGKDAKGLAILLNFHFYILQKSLDLLSSGQNEEFEEILKLYFCENVTKFFKPKSDPTDWSYDEEVELARKSSRCVS